MQSIVGEKVFRIGFKFKLKTKDLRALVEAYRRMFMFHEGKNPKTSWCGLGTPSHFNKKYFRCIDLERPRVYNWYALTDEGMKIYDELKKNLDVHRQTLKDKNELNRILFEFI